MHTSGKADSGLYVAMAGFESVKPGDKRGYKNALQQAERLVKCPIKQLAMVDTILAARSRAYGGAV